MGRRTSPVWRRRAPKPDPVARSPATGADYVKLDGELKARIAAARVAASRSVNRELIPLYWDIGSAIVERQRRLGSGESVVEALARDLGAFPGIAGFSARNLRDMKRFFGACSKGSRVSLPDSLKSFVDEQVSERGYGTSSECVVYKVPPGGLTGINCRACEGCKVSCAPAKSKAGFAWPRRRCSGASQRAGIAS